MQYQVLLLLLSATFWRNVLADVDIQKPEAGDSFSASGGDVTVSLEWKDDSDDSEDADSLDNVSGYTISLCTGSNSEIECFLQLEQNQKIEGNKYSATIKASDAPSGNFFFQIYTEFAKGWTNHYSPRFALTGMSGPKSATITINGAPTLVSLDVSASGKEPDPQLSAGDGTSINSASFTIPYTEQTGKSKFAPMQTQPGSTITATTWSRQYPTSSVSYFSKLGGTANVRTTITPGWSYTPKSAVNAASVAPFPTYYYPASERVTKASLSTAAKKRRWLE
ncbi:cell wall synthesis protein KRE9 precursor [Suhomyces tanzawaensis NRRL Y-17324]|uniref:Cell wall synthesis protein KRE9 n=1 Tax=Suhomyces tanzawaensis NRRL Y-17324 TaxID=984487 RepID=A0A1E4SI77_9ASCO|nr:cell wall synthesis protein KRE9 precursor [Suhomyces tanzawaensis NRRL Y-17324]ODV79206.1 cell wall synthesis protein KRE9 precursor [Suhomyces tanzawaensis NRRL Y-17324]